MRAFFIVDDDFVDRRMILQEFPTGGAEKSATILRLESGA